jgi:hypothetical protein
VRHGGALAAVACARRSRSWSRPREGRPRDGYDELHVLPSGGLIKLWCFLWRFFRFVWGEVGVGSVVEANVRTLVLIRKVVGNGEGK